MTTNNELHPQRDAHELMPGDLVCFSTWPWRLDLSDPDMADCFELWKGMFWIAERRGTRVRLEGVEGWFHLPDMYQGRYSVPWEPPEEPRPRPIRKLDGACTTVENPVEFRRRGMMML